MKRRYRYLLNRMRDLTLVAAVSLAAYLLIALALALREGRAFWPPLLALALEAVLCACVWVFFVVPYKKREQGLERLLRGYAGGEEESGPVMPLGPGDDMLLGELRQLLSPSQMFRLNKRQAQYLALQNQINPHFLYNTLESIRGEALIAGLDSVADMTEALAKFFRYTITKVENLVSVEEELDNCETYFWIQKYRFGDRLQLHINYEPEEWDQIMNCRIPKLTLQPILENSIIHGTELKIGTGNLYIRFELTQDRLLIRISDDGVGMDEETLLKLNRKLGKDIDAFTSGEEKQGGIALVNVNNRIRLIFGDEYGLHVYSVPQSGTDVEISIPMVTSDREIQNRSVLR